MTTTPIAVQPDVFELEGYDTQIHFATTSITGTAELIYTRRGETQTFKGADIKFEKTQLGQMITVRLAGHVAERVGSFESLTLLIPTVNLQRPNRESLVQTIAIFSLRSPNVLQGQSQNFMPLCLSGTASLVEF